MMQTSLPRQPKRIGFTIIEIVVTMTIMVIVISFSAPRMLETLEQSHADLAGANLRMVDTAQRFHWLENRTYATDLQTLIDDELLDANFQTAAPRYDFNILSADAGGFVVQARRRYVDDLGNPVYDGTWHGTFTLDENGVITGTVENTHNTHEIAPGF